MKTNFLNKLKQGLFLLIAVLGTFVGYSQSTQNSTIGGSKTPNDTGLLDIGGSKNSDGGLGIGRIVPIVHFLTETQCTFAFLSDTGGGKGTSTDTGQVNDPYDIGGRGGVGTGGIAITDIGGKNTPGDIGPGGFGTNPFNDFGDDTGGRGDVGTGGIAITEIGGGKGTSSDTGQVTNPNDVDPYDIGGRGTDLGTGLFASLEMEYLPGLGCIFDTGGRGGKGTSTGGDYNVDDDTGGRNSGGTTGEVYDLIPFTIN